MRILSPVRGGDRGSSSRGSRTGFGNLTRVPEMSDDGSPRTPRMVHTPRGLTTPISWAFTSELQSVQKSVGQHACNLKHLESKVCGVQRRLTESNNRIDALEAASCATAGKLNTPQKHRAEWSQGMVLARQDALSASITALEERFEIVTGIMASVVAASACKVDSEQDKLGFVPNVSTDDLQVFLANASNHIKCLEKLSERWKENQNKDPITAKGSLHLEEPQACAGAGHVHNLRVATLSATMAPACVLTGAATVPAPAPMRVNPLHTAPKHPLERVRLDGRRLAGTKGSKSSFTTEQPSESTFMEDPRVQEQAQAVQYTCGQRYLMSN